MANKRFSPPVMGASSLLSIFSVLCLVVFAVLSISTVQSQRKLSQTSSASAAGYYAADAKAEEILARLRAGEMPESVTKEGTKFRYTCSISDTQILEVEVELEGAEYTILRWQAAPATAWNNSDELNVWSGG